MQVTATVKPTISRVSHRKPKQTARRRALTLIELVIVIAILTVLGGLVVQTLPNLLETDPSLEVFRYDFDPQPDLGESFALNMKYPDRYDSLLIAAGTAFPKLPTGLSALITTTTLTPAEVKALNSIGIRNVVDLNPAAVDVTYDCAPLGAARRTIDGGSVAMLQSPGTGTSVTWNANPLKLRRHLETTDTVKYLVFGVGSNCTAIGAGKLMQEAPVHFGADDTINPSTVYQRYLAVFSLATSTTGIVTARFEAMAGNDTDGPSSAEDHIREYYEGQTKED